METNRRQFLQTGGMTAVALTGHAQGQNIKVPTCPTEVPQPTPNDFSAGPLLFRQVPKRALNMDEDGTVRPEVPANWSGAFGIGCGPCGIAKEWGESQPAGAAPEYLDDDDPDAVGYRNLRELVEELGTGRKDTEYYEIEIKSAEQTIKDQGDATKILGYDGQMPGPMLQARVGRPMVIRFINRVEDYMSVHLHGGHGPAHSDGHPAFVVPKASEKGAAEVSMTNAPGKYGTNHRDYFYPHTVPAKTPARMPEQGRPNHQSPQDNLDYGESPSTMWYHDHSMDITGAHVQMGLAGFFPAFDDHELKLLQDGVLPFAHKNRAAMDNLDAVFEAQRINPLDICLVLQDRCFDGGNQFLYSVKGHNGHLGHEVLVNGLLKPRMQVVSKKHRVRILDGSNARLFKLALHARIEKVDGRPADAPGELTPLMDRLPVDEPEWFRIGMDTWLYPEPVRQHQVLLAMAKRADMIIDFGAIKRHAEKIFGRGLQADERIAVYLCNLLDQESGRGPKLKLPDANAQPVVPKVQQVNVDGDPNKRLLNPPWPLLKFIIEDDVTNHAEPPTGTALTGWRALGYSSAEIAALPDAKVSFGTPLREHTPILPSEITRTRTVVFERGNGIWQINGTVVDEFLSNFVPELNSAECWILENGGGGWWHPIHIHLESHQLIEYLEELEVEEFKLIIGQVIAVLEQALLDESILKPDLPNPKPWQDIADTLQTLRESLAPKQTELNAARDGLVGDANDEISLQKIVKETMARLGELTSVRDKQIEEPIGGDDRRKAYFRLKRAYGGIGELVAEFSPQIVFEDHRLWSRVTVAPWDRYKSDTTILGPNTRVKIYMKFRTFDGPFVFHCHNLEHEDMRMMFVFDPRPTPPAVLAEADAGTKSVLPHERKEVGERIKDGYHLREHAVLYRHPWRFEDLPDHDKRAHTDSGPVSGPCEKRPPWHETPPVASPPKAHPIWGGWDQHI
ncbi:MAG: multicopper oxidase domain-containing protein [Verrucomicrobiales bacterium]|nr:multicopper oxidase domain-containing protein [Verrucomicrobiales bacterium]